MHSFITMKHDLVPDSLVYEKNALLFGAICHIVSMSFFKQVTDMISNMC